MADIGGAILPRKQKYVSSSKRYLSSDRGCEGKAGSQVTWKSVEDVWQTSARNPKPYPKVLGIKDSGLRDLGSGGGLRV